MRRLGHLWLGRFRLDGPEPPKVQPKCSQSLLIAKNRQSDRVPSSRANLRAIEFWRTRATIAIRRPAFSTIRERASITKKERSAYRIGLYDRSTDS